MTVPDRTASKISLVLADVDGTLLTRDKVLTSRAADAVKSLAAAGIAFAITSGRPPRGMVMLIAPLALRTPIAGFNGGVFVNPDLSVIESHTLDPATAKQTVGLILDQGLDAWVYTADEWLIHNRDAPHVAREAWTVQFGAKVVPVFTEEHLAHAVKIVGISDDLDLVAACEKLAQTTLGERASAARSQPYYLDVTHPQANKGAVVATLSRLLNVPPEQIVTLGDMPNDILMFRKSGFSIAMGNSSEKVKAQASAVTDSNEDEGFANAVRRFVLLPGRHMTGERGGSSTGLAADGGGWRRRNG
jgi:Cof subfamily protein (haloacid dehalogenase superfamily)